MIFGKRPYIFAVPVRDPWCIDGTGRTDKTKDPVHRAKGQSMRAFKLILVLVILGFAGLAGFAYLGDLTPPVGSVSQGLDLPEGTDGN